MFINFSNHPSSKWSEKQLKAAEEMGGTIVDIPFPNVRPELSKSDVYRMAQSIISEFRRVAGKEFPTSTFMVQGETTLCFAVISTLHVMPHIFSVVAATTARMMTEVDGQRTYSFEFVQFRKYV